MNFVSISVFSDEAPIVIDSGDDFGLKHSGSEIVNIAKQYAIDNHLSPVRQNRTFSASYGIESEIWLVSVSEP